MLLPSAWRDRVEAEKRGGNKVVVRAIRRQGPVLLGLIAGSVLWACGSTKGNRDHGERGSGGSAGEAASEPGIGGEGGEANAGGAAGATGCGQDVSVRTARRARSGGYSGNEEDYFSLYELSCETVSDCVQACGDIGGSAAMCEASECLDEFGDGLSCLPSTVWRNLDNILFEGTTISDAVEITLVASDYYDPLLTDEFKHEIPPEAIIRGITIELRRAGSDRVADRSVQILKGGERRTAERAKTALWTTDLTWVTYGGPDDLWGESWTAEDLNADDFGVAIELTYTRDSGNTRAFVDQVRATVQYDLPCN